MVKREENTRANVAINGQDNTAFLVYKFVRMTEFQLMLEHF
jgi:hypothetical protein